MLALICSLAYVVASVVVIVDCVVSAVVAAVMMRFAAAERWRSKGAYNDVSSTESMRLWRTLCS